MVTDTSVNSDDRMTMVDGGQFQLERLRSCVQLEPAFLFNKKEEDRGIECKS